MLRWGWFGCVWWGASHRVFFGLLKSFIGTSLMGFPAKPEQVHLLLKSNSAFARGCGLSHKRKDRAKHHRVIRWRAANISIRELQAAQ